MAEDREAGCGCSMHMESPSAQSRETRSRPEVGKEKALVEISELMGSRRAVASKHNRQRWLSWSPASTLPFYVPESHDRVCIPGAQIPTKSGHWGSQGTGKLPTSSSYLFYYKMTSFGTVAFNFSNSFLNHIMFPCASFMEARGRSIAQGRAQALESDSPAFRSQLCHCRNWVIHQHSQSQWFPL